MDGVVVEVAQQGGEQGLGVAAAEGLRLEKLCHGLLAPNTEELDHLWGAVGRRGEKAVSAVCGERASPGRGRCTPSTNGPRGGRRARPGGGRARRACAGGRSCPARRRCHPGWCSSRSTRPPTPRRDTCGSIRGNGGPRGRRRPGVALGERRYALRGAGLGGALAGGDRDVLCQGVDLGILRQAGPQS